MTTLNQLSTPAALFDLPRMERNIARMQRRMGTDRSPENEDGQIYDQ